MSELVIIIGMIVIIAAVSGFAFIEATGRIDSPKWDTIEWIVLGVGLLALMFIVASAILG